METALMETALGLGCVLICSIEDKGRVGVLLQQTCEPHEIDSLHPKKSTEKYTPKREDVVIWFDNLEGLNVLRDRLDLIALGMKGYKVVDDVEV